MAGGFEDPKNAMAMRDLLHQMMGNVVDSLRPGNQNGYVLRVYKGGPQFNVSPENSLPDAGSPPPQGPGNPQQVYYADVRLDNGSTVSARVQQDIPYARDALWWDGEVVQGQVVQPYFIVEGTYRKAITIPRTDYLGNTQNSIEPDMSAHVDSFPYVPPRVAVEGTAGKYLINEIIRGITSSEDALLRNPIAVGMKKAGVQDMGVKGKNLIVNSQEFNWYKQGWVGNTGFYAVNGSYGKSVAFEVELAYGASFQKYSLNTKHVRPKDYGKWMIVPPTYETFTPRVPTSTADATKNVLLACIDTGGNLHLYVASSDMTSNFKTSVDFFLNGSITVRSVAGPLVPVSNIPMPDITLTPAPKYVWGYTNTTGSPVDALDTPFARPVYRSSLSQDLLHLRQNLAFGTPIANGDQVNGYKLFWDKASTYTAKSIYKGSGYFEIMYPPVGTQIPLVSNSGVSYVTADADGIQFDGYYSLYYSLPLGADTGAASASTNFVIVDVNADFDIPEHWILIGSRPNVSPVAIVPPSTTVPVNVRVGAGNFHGAYDTGDSSRMAQVPYQVNLMVGAAMGIDIMAASELHEENNMHEYFLKKLKQTDADWALAEGDGGNQLLYRPSLYIISNIVRMGMPYSRNLSDFTVQDKATGFEFHVLVTHTQADDDDGTSRDKERQAQITFIANYAATLTYVIIGGDFNFKQDTNTSLRKILSDTAAVTGLQFRTSQIPNYNKDSISGSTGTNFSGNARWPDDLFTRAAQTVNGSAGVVTGNATDHYLWVRTQVGFLNDGTSAPSARPGATFQLGNGREVDAWHTIPNPPGWSHSTDHTFQYKRENGRVFFRGGLTAIGAKASATNMLNVLPVGIRPAIYTFQIGWYASFTPARVDINTGGTIITRTSMANGDQLFMDGISYSYEK